MTQKLSDRAQRLLQTWERRPYVEDLGLVRAAIEEVGLPVTEPVLDFHRTFAGYVTEVWGEVGPLGIIHPEIESIESWCRPMKVGGYLTADPPSLACADIHVSYEMQIELDGTYHCNGEVSSSYFLWTEQCALQEEFYRTRRARVATTSRKPKWLAQVLLPRLTQYLVPELSDRFGQVYATDRFIVSVGLKGQRYHVLIAEGESPAELAGYERPRSSDAK
jgi:hypothetical protein